MLTTRTPISEKDALATPARHPGGSPALILLVEYDPAVRQMLAAALPTFGFKVQVTAHSLQAIELYRHKRPDLVLLEIHMPEVDGPAALKMLKEIDPSVVCCFMSGYADPVEIKDLQAKGAVAVLQKPFSLEELNHVLLQALKTRNS